MFVNTLAHAGEVHGNNLESTIHSTGWCIQLAVFLLSLALLSGLVWLITKSKKITTIVMSALLLAGGFAIFNLTPLIGIVSISIGLLSGIFLLLVGFGEKSAANQDPPEKE